MSSLTFTQLIGNISDYAHNPAAVQTRIGEALTQVMEGGIDVVDPSNPFVLCLEASVANLCAFLDQAQALTRQQYPIVASSMSDLYRHMSDRDYIDRFAKPVAIPFIFYLNKNEVMNAMVTDPDTGIRRLRLPRNLVVRAGGLSFSLQYPVEIRQLTHLGLQIVYLTDTPSPLQTLQTNIVDWSVATTSNREFLCFNLELTQFEIVTAYADVNASSGFKTDVDFPDQFYYARVWHQKYDSVKKDYVYEEILTTHSRQIYDYSTPTALLSVTEGRLSVIIPPVYVNSNQLDGKIRIDCYVSRGEIDIRMDSIPVNIYELEWLNIDPADDDVYTAPVRTLSNLLVYSIAYARGGRSALTLEQLKARMLSNSIGTQNLPVTNQQTKTAIEDQGFSLTRTVDNVTSRMFWASRAMPRSSDEKILTAAAATMATVRLTLKQAGAAHGAKDNGKRITLSSKCLYLQSVGVTRPLTAQDKSRLDRMSRVDLCNELSQNQYFYSPFTYVLDATTDTFEARAYYMDAPKATSRSFVEDNPTTGLQVSSSSSITLQMNADHYNLVVRTTSSDVFRDRFKDSPQDFYAQLSFRSVSQDDVLYIVGNVAEDASTGEMIATFKIPTNWDISSEDLLYLTGDLGSNSDLPVGVELSKWYDLVYYTKADLGAEGAKWSPIAADQLIYRREPGENYKAITHERVHLNLGYPLPNLWTMSRSAVDTIPYQTYQTDVYYTHEKEVYEPDPQTGLNFEVVDGQVRYRITHPKGSYILDEQGRAAVRYKAGSVILDEKGNPIPEPNWAAKMVRFVDIFMVDGVYYFSSDSVVERYRKDMLDTVVGWITADVANFQKGLLERSNIYFTPKSSIGAISVLSSDNSELNISAQQSLTVSLVVPPRTYGDEVLREQLTRTTIRIIDSELGKSTISVSAMEYALRNAYGTDVIDVKITGLGSSSGVEQQVLSIQNNAMGCSLKKKLMVTADNKLIVTEDVTVLLSRHGVGV